MELEQLGNIDVAHSITICQTERPAIEVASHAMQASAGHCTISSFGESDGPSVFIVAVVKFYRGQIPEPDCYVFHSRFVVEEKILDYVTLITKTEHEFRKAVVSVELHDVPEDRS